MCLRIETGAISDYARLYYSTTPNSRKELLNGYLICGGDGVSITGTNATFDEFYVTLSSSRPRNNNRFFVDEMGNTSIISLNDNVTFDVNDSHTASNDTLYSNKNDVHLSSNTVRFNEKYPVLRKDGYDLNIVAFYDIAFKEDSLQKAKSADDVIERIFSLVSNFFIDGSLTTKLHLHLIKTTYKSDVIWNDAKSNATESNLKRLNFYEEENANIYVYMGSSKTDYDKIPGKVPRVGACSLKNLTCSGVCSDKKYLRTFVVECDVDQLYRTAYVIAHEIGHLLGIKHDFQDTNENEPLKRAKLSYGGKNCTNVNGIMDHGDATHNNLKWTACSIEYLRMYHQNVKDVSSPELFCLEPHLMATMVDIVDGQPLHLICDIRYCGGDNVEYVKWYLKPKVYVGYYSPHFNTTFVRPNYSDNINILYEREKVILSISTYANNMQDAYCVINADLDTVPGAYNQKTFCETKQTFHIKAPGK